MYCSNCGHKNADDARFCAECGTKLEAVASPEETKEEMAEKVEIVEETALVNEEIEEEATMLLEHEVVPEPVAEPEPVKAFAAEPVAEPEPVAEAVPVVQEPVNEPAPTIKTVPIVNTVNVVNTVSVSSQAVQSSANPVVETLKTLARSPLMIICSLLYTITSLVSIINIISHVSNVHDLTEYGLPSGFEFVVTTIASIFIIVTLLVVFGLWITVIQGFRKGNFSTAGLSMIKGVAVAQFVLVCISLSITLVAMFSVLGDMDSDMIPMVFVVVGICALVFTYYLLVVKSLTNAKMMAKGVAKKASAYVGIVLYISSVVMLIGLLIAMFVTGVIDSALDDLVHQLDLGDVEIPKLSQNPLSVILSFVSIVNTFMFGLLIFSQRGKVNELK